MNFIEPDSLQHERKCALCVVVFVVAGHHWSLVWAGGRRQAAPACKTHPDEKISCNFLVKTDWKAESNVGFYLTPLYL